MNAVILAAGDGTRLRPRTNERPKPLLEVAGQPILSHVFETVLAAGIREAVVVVGYRKEQITDYYGNSYRDLSLEYATQHERDGLAHAILAAEPSVEDDFLVLNGDNVYSADFGAIVDRHGSTDADITIPVQEVSRAEASQGAVLETNESGEITGIVEKPADPPSRLAPAASYVLPAAVFPACRIVCPSERGEYELPDAIDLLVHAGYQVQTVPFDGWRVNVNTEEDLAEAANRLDGT